MTGQHFEKASVSESESVCWTPSSHPAWLNLWLSWIINNIVNIIIEQYHQQHRQYRAISLSSMFEKQRAQRAMTLLNHQKHCQYQHRAISSSSNIIIEQYHHRAISTLSNIIVVNVWKAKSVQWCSPFEFMAGLPPRRKPLAWNQKLATSSTSTKQKPDHQDHALKNDDNQQGEDD